MKISVWPLAFILALPGCSGQCIWREADGVSKGPFTWYTNDVLMIIEENTLQADERIIRGIVNELASEYKLNINVRRGDFVPSPGIISINIYDGDFSERKAMRGREERSYFNISSGGACVVYNNIRCGKIQYSNVMIRSRGVSNVVAGDVSRCIAAALFQEVAK